MMRNPPPNAKEVRCVLSDGRRKSFTIKIFYCVKSFQGDGDKKPRSQIKYFP